MSTSAQATSVQINNIAKQNGKLFMQIGIAEQNQGSYQWQQTGSSESKFEVQLDTGSCGIVIPAQLLYEPGTYVKPVGTATPGGTLRSGVSGPFTPVHLTYQPSGDQLNGFQYTIDLLGLGADANGAPIAIAQNVTVVGADSKSFMMGIGFDRPMLADNAFLAPSVSASNGQPLNCSYYIDSEKIILGAVPNSSFVFQQLSPKPPGQEAANVGASAFPSFNSLLGELLVTDANNSTLLGPTPVSLLIDTGLDLMMINHINAFPTPASFVPPDATLPTTSPWETASIKISFNANSATGPSYQFTLGGVGYADFSKNRTGEPVFIVSDNPPIDGKIPLGDNSQKQSASPSLVDIIAPASTVNAPNPPSPPKSPFINTGFNPLFKFGILVEPSNTRVGFGQLP